MDSGNTVMWDSPICLHHQLRINGLLSKGVITEPGQQIEIVPVGFNHRYQFTRRQPRAGKPALVILFAHTAADRNGER